MPVNDLGFALTSFSALAAGGSRDTSQVSESEVLTSPLGLAILHLDTLRSTLLGSCGMVDAEGAPDFLSPFFLKTRCVR